MNDVMNRIEGRMVYLRSLVGETPPPPTQSTPSTPQFAAEFNQTQTEMAAPGSLEAFSLPSAPQLPSATPRHDRASRATPEALQPIIQEAASRTGLAPELIDAVIKAESGYRTNAVSRVGAQGLMQLMPGTARSLGVTNPFDARQNVMGGADYLSKQISRFGSVEKALAAYNAGPGAVQKFGGVPPYAETQRYVRKIIQDAGSAVNSKGESQ